MTNMSICLDDEKYERIRDMADEEKVNKQVIIRRLIQYGFAHLEYQKAQKILKAQEAVIS